MKPNSIVKPVALRRGQASTPKVNINQKRNIYGSFEDDVSEKSKKTEYLGQSKKRTTSLTPTSGIVRVNGIESNQREENSGKIFNNQSESLGKRTKYQYDVPLPFDLPSSAPARLNE